jgi:hypothetical protein
MYLQGIATTLLPTELLTVLSQLCLLVLCCLRFAPWAGNSANTPTFALLGLGFAAASLQIVRSRHMGGGGFWVRNRLLSAFCIFLTQCLHSPTHLCCRSPLGILIHLVCLSRLADTASSLAGDVPGDYVRHLPCHASYLLASLPPGSPGKDFVPP